MTVPHQRDIDRTARRDASVQVFKLSPRHICQEVWQPHHLPLLYGGCAEKVLFYVYKCAAKNCIFVQKTFAKMLNVEKEMALSLSSIAGSTFGLIVKRFSVALPSKSTYTETHSNKPTLVKCRGKRWMSLKMRVNSISWECMCVIKSHTYTEYSIQYAHTSICVIPQMFGGEQIEAENSPPCWWRRWCIVSRQRIPQWFHGRAEWTGARGAPCLWCTLHYTPSDTQTLLNISYIAMHIIN